MVVVVGGRYGGVLLGLWPTVRWMMADGWWWRLAKVVVEAAAGCGDVVCWWWCGGVGAKD